MLKLLALVSLAGVIYACRDESDNCKYYEDKGYNICNQSNGTNYCKKFCKICSSSGGGGGGGGVFEYVMEYVFFGRSSGQCGVSKVTQGRVVNGVTAKPGAWPWIASLQMSSGFHFCGGSVLTPNWILTASHCVSSKKDPSKLRVVVGAHNKNINENTQQKLHVKRIIMHPNYTQGGSLSADVALLELSTPLQLNDRVVKACMPQQGVYPSAGKNCFIAGWGTTNHPGSAPSQLQQAQLPVVKSPHPGCHNVREVVCVGHGFGSRPDGSQHPNACRGDSGGPLMCQNSDGRWQLEGVASYVHTYCKYYTAYAPVNKYLSWIKQHVTDSEVGSGGTRGAFAASIIWPIVFLIYFF